MKRFKLKKWRNKRNFKNTALFVHPMNLKRVFGRGGISL